MDTITEKNKLTSSQIFFNYFIPFFEARWDSTLLIVILTLYAYLGASTYDFFCKLFYGIPSDLMTGIDLSSFISPLGNLLLRLLVICVLTILLLFFCHEFNKVNKKLRLFKAICCCFTGLVIFLFHTISNDMQMGIICGIMIITLIIILFQSLINCKSVLLLRCLILGFIAIVLIIEALTLACIDSFSKEQFLIVNINGEKLALVDNYGDDKAIFAPIDIEKNTITARFQILDIKSNEKEKLELYLVKTGKIKFIEYEPKIR
ncbi:hypothetical protein ACQKMY_20930 [Peribacillus frigoritolerans]|uniref:hypothetical protein n=1 Tax=Peribacillus frigoritolerans TaxID=450367 RepID=UPI003CFD8A84